MRLLSFRVEKFRNFLDSTEVDVDPSVTCLVGKNESGKTAALQALYRLNPVYGESFDTQAHYPRWRLIGDRREGTLETGYPITAKFELDEADETAVTDVLGEGVLLSRTVIVHKNYDNVRTWSLRVDEAKAASNFVHSHSVKAVKRFAKVTDLPSMREALAAQLEEATKASDEDAATSARAMSVALAQMSGDAETFESVARGILTSRLPKFFYFGDYQMLPGDIDLRGLNAEEEHPGASGLQTARALLALAETDVASITEEDWTARKAELEAVSNDLTKQVSDYWTQNTELQVVIDVDKETINTGNGQTAVARNLKVQVKDARHGFSNSFDDRSTGFRWFFSFLAAFSEFEGRASSSVIVLLDEPGLTLHGHAQKDFLRFIDERLAPRVQVIYTTHSPFMVAPGHLERVRIVEDRGPETGAVVTQDVLAVAEESLFPLQGALGYDIAQHLFIGDTNVLVEGTSDFTYITLLSDHLKTLGRTCLDPRWRILPAGGSSNIPTFVALMGRSLAVTVVVDASKQGMQRLRKLTDEGLLRDQRLITIADVTGGKYGDIEDLFSVEDYLSLYNSSHGSSLAVSELEPGDRIIDRISRTSGQDFTDHGVPADVLLRRRDEILPTLGEETLERFEDLIGRINDTLPD